MKRSISTNYIFKKHLHKNIFDHSNMSKIKLNNDYKNLTGSYVIIKPSEEITTNNYSKVLLHRVLSILNALIGAHTNINYHIEKVVDFTIKIPIFSYTNEEKKLSLYDLVDKRINTLRDFLETINWDTMTNKIDRWAVISLRTLGVNISTDLVLTVKIDPTINYPQISDEPLCIPFPKVVLPELERVKFSDNSTITYLSSPLLTDYGVYVNLSVTFDEMGMSWNALHLYEHLMTKGWDNINNTNLVLMNGVTWPNGLCSVFAITSDIPCMKTYAASYIKYFLESRAKDFWKQQTNLDSLKLETVRTISETHNERSLTSLARSDLHAYNFEYNTNIFTYWSNKPFNIFIAGPDPIEKLKLNSQTIESYIKINPINHITRPRNITFKNLPIDTLKTKKIQQYHVLSEKLETIRKELLHMSDNTNVLYGVDCKIVSSSEDLGPYNTVIHPLVFLNNLFTTDELVTFVKSTVIPFSCTFFDSCALKNKYAGEYLPEQEQLKDILDLNRSIK